ncbi:MAG: pilus assembly protein PilN [Methylococcaceae bacterium]|nr:MAG: pilus assembly protein PilN [Methylococcaceae bacterium]
MARINLLPWRAELRKKQQQEFFAAIGAGVILVCIAMVFVHMHMSGSIGYQNQRNKFLDQEISALNKQIAEIKDLEAKKNRLVAKMEVIQQLQGSRPGSVHLFDELAKTVPDGIKLDEITQDGRNLAIKGVAQSNARVSAYMRNLDLSPWLEKSVLSVIETKSDNSGERPSKFELKVQQRANSTGVAKE